jgi:hypothetical protein
MVKDDLGDLIPVEPQSVVKLSKKDRLNVETNENDISLLRSPEEGSVFKSPTGTDMLHTPRGSNAARTPAETASSTPRNKRPDAATDILLGPMGQDMRQKLLDDLQKKEQPSGEGEVLAQATQGRPTALGTCSALSCIFVCCMFDLRSQS